MEGGGDPAGRRCPLCGDVLLGWVIASGADPADTAEYLVERCEGCGLGVAAGAGRDPAEEVERFVADLDRGGRLVLQLPNRSSLQASLAGRHWTGLDLPRRTVYPTPRALRLALDRAGLQLVRLRFPVAGQNTTAMWRTLLNGVTFHHEFLPLAASGRLRPRTARSRGAFAVDLVVSLLAAIPAALIALPLEAAAALARRGGTMEVVAERAIEPDRPDD